ncbi:MAG: AzlC family ABC transporter permease [Clostridia bacterium]|nr:AzlC family ABC transporter permease [Clostridia bacterium]
MKQTIKKAFIATVPVLAGYLALGFGFGIILNANGYGILVAFIMSLSIYAGSMQYVAVGLLASDASLITVAVTTFVVNVRHLFYGISMLDKYKNIGKIKAYLMFALTDETYSLLCNDNPIVPESRKKQYYFFVSFLNHMYWITGCVLGATVGTLVKFNSEGIDFVLTALFVTIFIEQWLTSKKHVPAIIGVAVTALCLIIFGSESFLIPAMIVITILLSLYKEGNENA